MIESLRKLSGRGKKSSGPIREEFLAFPYSVESASTPSYISSSTSSSPSNYFPPSPLGHRSRPPQSPPSLGDDDGDDMSPLPHRPIFRLFPPAAAAPTLPSSNPNPSVPFSLLLFQCRFLAHQWQASLGVVTMVPGVGAIGLSRLMVLEITYGGVVCYHLDRIVTGFRFTYPFVARPPPSDLSFGQRFPFGDVTPRSTLAQLCSAWRVILLAFRSRFSQWLEESPEAALEGLKACLSKLVAIHSSIQHLGGDEDLKRPKTDKERRAEQVAQQEEVDYMRERVEKASAAYLSHVDTSRFPGTPAQYIF